MVKSNFNSSNLSRMLEQQRQIQIAFQPLALKYSSMRGSFNTPLIQLARKWRNEMKPLYSVQASFLESLRPIVEQKIKINEAIKPLALEYSSMIKTFQQPTIRLLKTMQVEFGAIYKLQQTLLSSNQELLTVQSQLRSSIEPLTTMLSRMPLEAIRENIAEFQLKYPEYQNIEFQVSDDDKVLRVNNESILVKDISEALENILQERLKPIHDKIDKIVSDTVRNIVVSLILSFLVGLFFYILSVTSNPSMKVDLHVLKKESQNIELSTEQRQHLRFVYVKTVLHVRKTGNTHSDIIDFLQPGTIVHLDEKHKNWAKVSYIDPLTQKTFSGWVYSRYLRKFQ